MNIVKPSSSLFLFTILLLSTFLFSHAQDSTAVGLFRLEVSLYNNYIQTWKTVANELRTDLAPCYGASSVMLSGPSLNKFVLFGSQSQEQVMNTDCQSSNVENVARSVVGVSDVISFGNNLSLPSGADCIDTESANGDNLMCGEGCTPCPVGSLCEKGDLCIYGECGKVDPTDQYAICLYESTSFRRGGVIFASILSIIAAFFFF